MYVGDASKLNASYCQLSGNRVSDSLATEGGALYVQGSDGWMNHCTLSGNVATGGQVSAAGGAVLMFTSSLNIRHCELTMNTAQGGSSASGGAISTNLGTSWLEISASYISKNRVQSETGEAAGGALKIGPGSTATILDTEIRSNIAMGRAAKGGGIMSSQAKQISVQTTKFLENRVVCGSHAGSAFGGAIFHEGGFLLICESLLAQNIAQLEPEGARASAGAIYNANGGTVRMEGSTLLLNSLVGSGYYDISEPEYIGGYSQYTALAADMIISTAADMYSAGAMEMVNCSIVRMNPSGGNVPTMTERTEPAWILVAAGTFSAESCTFSSDFHQRVLLRLLTHEAAAVIRGCYAYNVTLESTSPMMGVVNSIFEPPLSASVATITPDHLGSCGFSVGSSRLCDPRAKCTLVRSGGVQCSCTEGGLLSPGAVDDGSMCKAKASAQTAVVSRSAFLRLPKPSTFPSVLSLQVCLAPSCAAKRLRITDKTVVVTSVTCAGGCQRRNELYRGIYSSFYSETENRARNSDGDCECVWNKLWPAHNLVVARGLRSDNACCGSQHLSTGDPARIESVNRV